MSQDGQDGGGFGVDQQCPAAARGQRVSRLRCGSEGTQSGGGHPGSVIRARGTKVQQHRFYYLPLDAARVTGLWQLCAVVVFSPRWRAIYSTTIPSALLLFSSLLELVFWSSFFCVPFPYSFNTFFFPSSSSSSSQGRLTCSAHHTEPTTRLLLFFASTARSPIAGRASFSSVLRRPPTFLPGAQHGTRLRCSNQQTWLTLAQPSPTQPRARTATTAPAANNNLHTTNHHARGRKTWKIDSTGSSRNPARSKTLARSHSLIRPSRFKTRC